MSNKTLGKSVTRRTTFKCEAPDAKAVFVAGDFNGWSTTATRLDRLGDEQFSASVDLPPGRYQYKFLVDGMWCCKPGCNLPAPGCGHCLPNPYGTMNRMIDVK